MSHPMAEKGSTVLLGGLEVQGGVSPAFAEGFVRNLENCRMIHLGPGAHYPQEDHSEAIGAALQLWLIDLTNADQS